jgi:hypothetical protein
LTTNLNGLEVNYKLGGEVAAKMTVDGFCGTSVKPKHSKCDIGGRCGRRWYVMVINLLDQVLLVIKLLDQVLHYNIRIYEV